MKVPKAKKLPLKECIYCLDEFTPIRKWQVYCSKKCRWDDWNEKNPRVKKGNYILDYPEAVKG